MVAQFSRYSWVALPHGSTSSIETETYASTELHPHEYEKKTHNARKLTPTNLNDCTIILKSIH